ncbi:MAG: DUF6273 domain-containing protein [Clostridia bacterium]
MPPPRGGGALLRNLSDKNALSSASLSGQNATENLTPQEQLLAGTLELDPENDPVIYTTDYGLDIKWHMAGLPNDPSDIETVPTDQRFALYAYFTHADVNWVIIGWSNKSNTLSTGFLNLANIATYYQKAGYYNFSNTTSGIWQYLKDTTEDSLDAELTDVYANYGGFFYNQSSNTISQKDVFPNAKSTSELETNEVLCFAQNMLTTAMFDSNGNCYYNSSLMGTMNTFYDKNLTDLPIEEKTLKTVWRGAADTTNGSNLPGTYKIFPLAGANANESFYVLNYLTNNSNDMQQSSYWWLRSGVASTWNNAYRVADYGARGTGGISNYWGVRPAFVLKI